MTRSPQPERVTRVKTAAIVLFLALAPLLAHGQGRRTPPEEDGRARRVTLAVSPGKPCDAKGARALRAWLQSTSGTSRATATCRGSTLVVTASCRRGAASPCTAATRGMETAVERQAGLPGDVSYSPCHAGVQHMCDAYYAATGFQSCIKGDVRCDTGVATSPMIKNTSWFPPPVSSWPYTRAVSCGGTRRLLEGGALLSGIQIRRSGASGVKAVSGVACTFSDQTTVLLGSWNPCLSGPCNTPSTNDTTLVLGSQNRVALAKSPLAEMQAWTDGQYPSRLCNVYIKLQNGERTTLPRPEDGCTIFTGAQEVDWAPYFASPNAQLLDAWALVDNDDRLWAVQFSFLTFTSLSIERVAYQKLATQAGPLPSLNLGVLVDNEKSSIGGDVSCTIGYTTTQKTALTTSETVGESVTKSWGISATFKSIPIPEYSTDETWSESETKTDGVTNTIEREIVTNPKVYFATKETIALYTMMFNGTATLPYTAYGLMEQKSAEGNSSSMPIAISGAIELTGSLKFYSAGVNPKEVPGYNESAASKPFTPSGPVPTVEYPTGAPSMFATPYVDANKGTILPGKGSIKWCGDSMPHGGVRNITGAWVVDPTWPTGILTGFRLGRADGTIACGDMGELSVPGVATRVATFKFLPDERFVRVEFWHSSRNEVICMVNFFTNLGNKFQVGEIPLIPKTESILYYSTQSVASGVLDGFGWVLKYKSWPGGASVPYIWGLSTVMLQPFIDMSIEILKTEPLPVPIPTIAGSFDINSVSSQSQTIKTTSTIQYDFGSTIKNGWSFSKTLKLGKIAVPKIPVSASVSKKWTESNEMQKGTSSTWSQKSTTQVVLNADFSKAPPKSHVVIYAKEYQKPSTIPYNGAVTVTFASSRVRAKVGLVQDTHTWKFSGDMAAQDGSFTIFDIADVIKPKGSDSGNDTVSAEGIMALGNGTDASVTDDVSPGLAAAAAIVLGYRPNGNYTHATLAATLLALPDEDPRKHKALGMYKVLAGQTTWADVCNAVICEPALAEALNGGVEPEVDAMVILPTLG